MTKSIFIKKISVNNIENEIKNVGFDSLYVKDFSDKYKHYYYKIFNLRAPEANILKQLCLSLGFDCAVNRGVITCECEYTDCIVSASISQLKKLAGKLKLQPFKLKLLAQELEKHISTNIPPLIIRKNALDWSKPYIMGILNITPDSFSDGGKYFDTSSAIEKAIQMIEDGADIIDIGGESTRPNAETITIEEEIKRIIPVIKELRRINQDIIISVDTRNFKTAKEAIESGADIINDVSGLDYDSEMLNFVCSDNIPVVVMHSDTVPATSSLIADDNNNDVVEEIYKSLFKKIKLLNEKGLDNSKIIVDPGIGFGKSPKDSFEILKRMDEFSTLNCPVLVGISRKSFISKTFNIEDKELDYATSILDSFLLTKSVNILRVHDVKMHKTNLELLSGVL